MSVYCQTVLARSGTPERSDAGGMGAHGMLSRQHPALCRASGPHRRGSCRSRGKSSRHRLQLHAATPSRSGAAFPPRRGQPVHRPTRPRRSGDPPHRLNRRWPSPFRKFSGSGAQCRSPWTKLLDLPIGHRGAVDEDRLDVHHVVVESARRRSLNKAQCPAHLFARQGRRHKAQRTSAAGERRVRRKRVDQKSTRSSYTTIIFLEEFITGF